MARESGTPAGLANGSIGALAYSKNATVHSFAEGEEVVAERRRSDRRHELGAEDPVVEAHRRVHVVGDQGEVVDAPPVQGGLAHDEGYSSLGTRTSAVATVPRRTTATLGVRVKSIFFHLMPYRDLPDDFEERYESVWVTPPNTELCDPAKVAQYYKWNLDELELADQLGFDGLGVNEHHQNAYGFMASPNLMAAALARRTPNNSAILVLGNTLALYSPALRVAEEFAMLDCMTDGRLAAGFPVGTSMDVNRCYGITPTETRPRFYEAHDLIMKAWTQPGPFTVQRPVQQAALRQPMAPAAAEAAPAGVAGRRRFGGDVRDGREQRLHVQLPQLLRLPLRQEGDGHVLGDGGPARRRPQPVPRRLRPADLRGRDRRAGRGAVQGARHVLLQEVPARARRTSWRPRATAPSAASSSS